MILESSVERVEVCVCNGVDQGVTTRNSPAIPRSYNAEIHRYKRAIRRVAKLIPWMNCGVLRKCNNYIMLHSSPSDQLRNLG